MEIDDGNNGSSSAVPEQDGPECKKPKLMDDTPTSLDDHAKAMKVAGFSLSAIEEMRNRAEEDCNSQTLDQQLRHFQVLDEVGSNSEDEEGK